MTNHFSIAEDTTDMRIPGTYLPRIFPLKNGYNIIICIPATRAEKKEIDGEPYPALIVDEVEQREFFELFAHFLEVHASCQLSDEECDEIMIEIEEEE